MSRSEISLKEFAVSSRKVSSSRLMPSRPSRCRCVKGMLALLGGGDDHFVPPIALGKPDLHRLIHRGLQILFDVIGAGWHLHVTAIDEHDELPAARPAEVQQSVHCRTHCAARKKHIVEEHDALPLDCD